MKNYEKPELKEIEFELEDIIAASLDENLTNHGVMESINDFFGEV